MRWWRASREERLVSSNLFPSAVILALASGFRFVSTVRIVRQKGGGGSGKKAATVPTVLGKKAGRGAGKKAAKLAIQPPISARREINAQVPGNAKTPLEVEPAGMVSAMVKLG
jgi:hypothetical protein